MKINETIQLPLLWSIQTGVHLGLPAARFLKGSVVVSTHVGPGAKKRAFKSYHRADARIPTYEIGSSVEPDMDLPEDLIRES